MPQNKAGSKPAGVGEADSTDDVLDTQQTQDGVGGKLATWDDFLKTQPEDIRVLYDKDVQGLKNSLTASREERVALEKNIKEIKKTLGSDPEKAKKEMDQLSIDFQNAQKRIAFLEEAADPAVECLNPAAAWLIASANNLFRSTGSPDWQEIKKTAPQLFGKAAENINAGDGTDGGGPPKTKNDMNSWIRSKAGIRE